MPFHESEDIDGGPWWRGPRHEVVAPIPVPIPIPPSRGGHMLIPRGPGYVGGRGWRGPPGGDGWASAPPPTGVGGSYSWWARCSQGPAPRPPPPPAWAREYGGGWAGGGGEGGGGGYGLPNCNDKYNSSGGVSVGCYNWASVHKGGGDNNIDISLEQSHREPGAITQLVPGGLRVGCGNRASRNNFIRVNGSNN